MYKKSFFLNILAILLFVLGKILESKIYISLLLILILLYSINLILKFPFEIKIMIIFINLYTIVYLQYFIFSKKLSVYFEYNTFEYLYQNALLMYLFVSILFVNLKMKKNEKIILKKYKGNIYTECLNIILIFYFILTGIKGKIGDYREVILTTKIEYLILPYLNLKIFSRKIIFNVLIYILFLLSIYLILIGVRAPAISLLFLIIILKEDSLKNYKTNKGIILIFFVIILFKIVGELRISENKIGHLIEYFISKQPVKIIVNNESDVIYAGTALIALIKKGILDIEVVIKTWIALFFDFFRINILTEYKIIPVMVDKITKIGGGGLISSQLYYLGKEYLVIIISFTIANIINKTYITKSNLLKIYGIILLITIVRWYPYSIISLYKMPIYAVLFYNINLILYNFVKKYQKKSK